MISWAVERSYKGVRKLTIYPHFQRKEIYELARSLRAEETNPQANTTVRKVAFNLLPTCGCRIVDDVGVTCKRHTRKDASEKKS